MLTGLFAVFMARGMLKRAPEPGLVLPLVKGSMPDFGPVFERYANDLKREAEQAAN